MVRDSGYSLRARKEVEDDSVKNSTRGKKDAGNSSVEKASVARKEVDDDNVKINSRSKKDAGNSSVEKASVSNSPKPPKSKLATPSPGTRKSLRLESHRSPSPLSMLNTGEKAMPSNCSGQKKAVQEHKLSEEKRKTGKDEGEDSLESEKSGSQSVSGRKRKGVPMPPFRKMFKVQCVRTVEFISDDEEIEGAEEFSADAVGVTDSQSGPSLKESLSDDKGEGTNSPSVMNLDSGNLERSSSLTIPQDASVQSEVGDKFPDPKDANGLLDGCGIVSADPTVMGNVVGQPPDADGLKDSCPSLRENMVVNVADQPSYADGKESCPSLRENVLLTNSSSVESTDSLEKEISNGFVKSKIGALSENGDNCIHPEVPEATPSPKNNSGGVSEMCGNCSKRKRVSTCSPETDLCSCGATVIEDVIENPRPSTRKDGGDQEAAVTTLETGRLGNNLLKEPHSDHLINGRENVFANGSNIGENLCKRKSRMIADTRTSRFLEYWLPVLISNHQLEQICAILLSSSIHLWSVTKTDRIGALHDTLENVRKVCDHSYLRDLSLQGRLIYKEIRPAEEVLDIAIKASGKMELLDMMLTEIKIRGSQVLILFQSIRGESVTNGDILSDFLQKRFGDDSYEHVEGVSPKKQDAVNRFNKKEKGVFVFLLETRACSSAIKLSSLDNIIIYNSDWNPLNDLRALQKISIGSTTEQIKVFRLYSSFTCEERSLILAKQNANNTESSLQTSSRVIIDNLLMWGASHLFRKLNDYHAESTSSLSVSTQRPLLTEVIEEFRSILSESCDNGVLTAVIAKAYKLEGGWYSSNIPLLGQKQIIVEECQEPHVFWRNLLDRKTPCWKLSEEPCSRNRKRVQYLDELPSKPHAVNGDVGNKRRKAANENVDPVLVEVELNWSEVPDPKGGPSTVATYKQSHSLHKNGVTETSNLNSRQTCNGAKVNTLEPNVRKGPHSSLLGQMMELCKILKFSDDVTDSAKRFLDYIIKNHDVNSDSPATLHAFILSLCWIAASISKQKVDKKDSLLLAKQHLNYQCTEELAQSVYSKMRPLKKMYLPEQDVNREPLNVDEGAANLASSNLPEVRTQMITNPANEEHESDSKISKIERKCLKRQKRLMRKHQEELQELKRTWEEKKRNLEKDHDLEAAVVRTLFPEGCSTRTERLKRFEDVLQMKLKEYNLLMEGELKNLVAAQDATMKEEKQKAECWLFAAKAHSFDPTTVTMPLVDATVVTASSQLLEDQNPNGSVCPQGNDPENPAPKNQSVEFTTDARAEVPQTAQNENVSLDKNNSCSVEQLNRTELVLPSQPNLLPEVASQVEVTTVQQSSGVLKEGGLHEVEHAAPIKENHRTINSESVPVVDPMPITEQPNGNLPTAVEKQSNGVLEEGGLHEVEHAAPIKENQRTVNSESVPIVDPMPFTEQPNGNLPTAVENQCLHTSTERQTDISRPVDSSNNAMSSVELQNQDVPALENGRNSHVGSSNFVDTVETPERITEQLHAEPPIVENQSTIPISETAENVIHHQSNVEGPGFDQGGNSSQIAEVTETELLRDEPAPQNEDLNLRRVVHSQSVDALTYFQNNVAVTQTVHNAAEPANGDVLQEGINVNHHHHHRSRLSLNLAAHQLPSLNPPPSVVDPLQCELERMTKEKDQLQKSHVDMAAHLKSDCEKEIEEMVNQIRQKYQMKLQESETEHTTRNTELEMNIKKMQANVKLAEAFRYKCLDVRLPGPSGNHQGASSSGVYSQQMRQLTMLQQANSVRQSAGASSAFQPSTNQQNPSSIIQPGRPQPSRLSTVTGNSATPIPTPTPAPAPAQLVQHTASPLIATPPSRPPPVVGSITHNPRMPTGELRSPTTHLQSVSPAPHVQSVSPAPHVQSVSPAPHLQSVSPAPHLQSVSPALHLHSVSPAPHLHSVSPAPHLQSYRPSAGPPVPPTTSASRPQYQPLTFTQAQQFNSQTSENGPGARGRLPSQLNQSTSAVALLIEMDRGSRVPPANTASVSRGVSPTCGTLESSELGVVGNVHSDRSPLPGLHDVVCLSDDD